MGHEMVGEEVAVGDEDPHVRLGDRVIVPFQFSCGRCDTCRRGATNACGLAPSVGLHAVMSALALGAERVV